jgi:hypothetical protein
MRPERVLLVDRDVVGLRVMAGDSGWVEQAARVASTERETEHGLAGRPHDAIQPQQCGGTEHVVRAQDIDLEGRLDGPDPGRGDGRQVDDGVGTPKRLDGLAVVGQVGPQERRDLRSPGRRRH